MAIESIAFSATPDELRVLTLGNPGMAIEEIRRIMYQYGYKEERGSGGEIMFASGGSKTSSVLWGGLAGRNEFFLRAIEGTENSLILVSLPASVFNQGAIGISRMRKELLRLSRTILPALGSPPHADSVDPSVLGGFGVRMKAKSPSRTPQYIMIAVAMIIAMIVGFMVFAAMSK
jgi:hypothetical protein